MHLDNLPFRNRQGEISRRYSIHRDPAVVKDGFHHTLDSQAVFVKHDYAVTDLNFVAHRPTFASASFPWFSGYFSFSRLLP
jgi:hypothetical protein